MEREYRPEIDVLRGVSVFLVIGYHTFPEAFPGGFVGVDIFFVISGFLITSIVVGEERSGSFRVIKFYSRRIRRLFPALATVLSTTLVLGWLFLFPDELAVLGKHTSLSVIFALNYQLISEIGYFDPAPQFKPLMHLWSLAVEEQFYLVWPLLCIATMQIRKNPIWILAILCVASFISALVSGAPNHAHLSTTTRIWQLGAGCILALAPIPKPPAHQNLIGACGLAMIAVYVFSIGPDSQHKLAAAILPIAGAMVIISSRPKWGPALGFRTLGLISYPAYLWHWILISFASIYLGHPPSAIGMLLCVTTTLLAAFLTYRYVETLRYRSGIVSPYLVSLMLAIGMFGYLLTAYQGLPNRGHLAYLKQNAVELVRTPERDRTCEHYVGQHLSEQRLFEYCRAAFASLSRSKIALIGDSHAHALFHGISRVADRNGYDTVLLANSSCPPFIGFRWGKNKRDEELCQSAIGQILEVIKRDQSIRLVLLSTRGPVYIHGEVKGKFTKASVLASLAATNSKSPNLTYTDMSDGLSNTVHLLSHIRHIDRVYYLLENHELDHHPKERIPRPLDYFNLSQSGADMSRSLYLLRSSDYRDVLKAVAASTNLYVLDTTNLFCDSRKCRTFYNNITLFSDNDHVSRYGSLVIARFLEHQIFP